jgi:tetratricopeptide (TPR) repeat protein
MTDAPTTPDPIEIAMEAEASGHLPEGVAHEVLRRQAALLDADLTHRRWQIAGERAGFALKVLTALAGLAVAGALALMAWDASRADGLVVEAFLVPPDLAARGVTGEVVARDILDRLGQLDAESQSLDSVRVSDAWTETSKIQVAETGVSLDDVLRLLRRWLGHETYVSGEVTPGAPGPGSVGSVRLKLRSGPGRAIVVEGPADQLPILADAAAERLFAQARPLVYAEVLLHRGNPLAAQPILARTLATSQDPHERDIALYLGGTAWLVQGRFHEALTLFRQGTGTSDALHGAMAHGMQSVVQRALGHPPESRAAISEAIRLIARADTPTRAVRLANYRASRLSDLSDYEAAERVLRPIVGRPVPGQPTSDGFRPNYANLLSRLHRISDANRAFPADNAMVAAAQEDWAAAMRLGAAAPPGQWSWRGPAPWTQALRVLVLARVGRLEEARAVAATLPADCVDCFVSRAVLASIAGDRAGAEALFAAAVRLDPVSANTLLTWGRERLAWGRPDAAIETFAAAARVAPRFADPLAWWGEALLIKGDAAGAAGKFAQAEPMAPKWGRLHLKWGEALARQGKADAARAQWRLAAGLDLLPDERAELLSLPVWEGTDRGAVRVGKSDPPPTSAFGVTPPHPALLRSAVPARPGRE